MVQFLFAVGLWTSLPGAAQVGVPDYEPVGINQTEEATFPRSLVNVGIKSGAASIAVAVDADGRVTDYLVTAYSHPAFAESAVAAMKKWIFRPAEIHGERRNSKVDLTFRFELEGVVVYAGASLGRGVCRCKYIFPLSFQHHHQSAICFWFFQDCVFFRTFRLSCF